MRALSLTLTNPWRQAKHFDRRQWARYVCWLAVFTSLLFYVAASRYLPYIETTELRSGLYLTAAYIGHFGSLPVLLGMALLPLALLLPSRTVMLPVSGLLVIAGVALLALDVAVYAQYRFHVSGFVWDLLVGPGSGDMFRLSWFSALTALAIFVGIVLAVLMVVGAAVWVVQRNRFRGTGKYVLALWFGAFSNAQLMHVWYEAHYDAEVAGVTRHFPLYYPFTGKRLLADLGWLDPAVARRDPPGGLDRADDDILYPVRPLECETPDDPMNVLVIVIDAMRWDMFEPNVMPNLFKLTERDDALHFTNHLSGGNVTKGGIFSLFYGLPATYWDAFAAAGVGAEWVGQHQRADYQIGVFSSTTLRSPAFDRTVFASVPALRLSSDGDSPSAKDKASINDFDRFLTNRSPDSPYFGFLFLDSAHGYDVPAGYEKFQPQWARVDHVKLNNDFDPEPYFNRYRNSLHFLDDAVGDLLERMSSRGDLENTLVVLTSDHGEEFNDLGQNYWGHGSNFSKYQIKVPLLMLWPGKTRSTVKERTSHFDIAPTVLSDVLGCSNEPSDYSTGRNLFSIETERDWLLVHSYFNYGVVTEDQIITTFPVGGYEIRDWGDHQIVNAELDFQTGSELLREVRRFYR